MQLATTTRSTGRELRKKRRQRNGKRSLSFFLSFFCCPVPTAAAGEEYPSKILSWSPEGGADLTGKVTRRHGTMRRKHQPDQRETLLLLPRKKAEKTCPGDAWWLVHNAVKRPFYCLIKWLRFLRLTWQPARCIRAGGRQSHQHRQLAGILQARFHWVRFRASLLRFCQLASLPVPS